MWNKNGHGWSIALGVWLLLVVGYVSNNENNNILQPGKVLEAQPKPQPLPKFTVVTQQLVVFPPPPPLPDMKSPGLIKADSNQRAAGKTSELQETIKSGRLWLAKLEQGEGPSISISWPKDPNDYQRLQKRLYDCGVRLGKWHHGRLRAIEPGYDTVSGFVRVLMGDMSANEIARLDALKGMGQPVRLFPRHLDITLLTGLSAVSPKSFYHAKEVTAQYEIHGGAVKVGGIVVDGKPILRNINLLPSNRDCS
ncbi:MAG: hypothetical protein COA99_11465 [Moraxellaceae bacterium]|nr:MAG: hypothetical protein COA99_11465 [Moraxellaceae bacterium]